MTEKLKHNELSKEFIKRCKKDIEDKIIHQGRGKLTQRGETEAEDILLVDFEGYTANLTRDELDYQRAWGSLVPFVSRDIIFVIKDIDEETGKINISRKEAQEIYRDMLVEGLEAGETYEAEITGMLPYGAYVSINEVYALLRNVDFSNGYIKVSDEHEIGDTIEVKLKNIDNAGKIAVQPVEKLKVDSILNFEMFEPDQVVEGVVRSVRSFGAFVGIAPGVDALCSVPATGEIEEGSKVTFRITKVFTVEEDGKEVGRVRGKIVNIID